VSISKSIRLIAGTAARAVPTPDIRRWSGAGAGVQPFDQATTRTATATLGWLPLLAVVGALGLLLVAIAFNGSRAGAGWAEVLFWAGLLVLYAPIALRVVSAAPTRAERVGLIVFLGLALYLVKVMQNPVGFTYPDEFIHQYNVDQILQTHHLFNPNAGLPVTPFYPGLSTVTAALAALSGLSDFVSGLVVIGAARLVLLLALFLFTERISGSERIGAITTLLYTTNPNFVYFSAEFAYESLALPLAFMVAFVVSERESAESALPRLGLTVVALLGIMAVVVTHHLTSYALVAFLLLLALLFRLVTDRWPWGLLLIGLFALSAALEWLFFVAGLTLTYLAPVVNRALQALLAFLEGQGIGRDLFTSTSGTVAPLWERLVGVGSALLDAFGLPFGLVEIRQHYRRNPFALLLGAAALVYFVVLGLRFFPATWEIANRTSEFVFVGVAFVLALTIVGLTGRERPRGMRALALVAGIAVLFMGGLIAGWSPNVRLARPYVVEADGYAIQPQGLTAAKWTRKFLGTGNIIITDPSNMHFLLTYGNQRPLTGGVYGIQPLMYAKNVDQSVINILRSTQARYVLFDHRTISWDQLAGVYFDRAGTNADTALFPPQVNGKFDQQSGVSRIFDSGNIVIYDVGALSGVVPTP
jgi:hypothetical protein